MAKTPQTRGFGNVRKPPPASWQVRYTDAHGLAQTGSITCSSKREAAFEFAETK
jgi:hypothetical protein